MGKLLKYKILAITGTRADYGLLKSTLKNIESSYNLELCLVATGMHSLKRYGNTKLEIIKDGFRINHTIQVLEHDDMLTAFKKEIGGLRRICIKERPDAILVLGDRDEQFAGAIVGGHLKIPVFHIHGGDLSGYLVDEYIRHSITKFSHLHFTVTQKSYERVLSLGEEDWRVFKVGAPGLDGLVDKKYFSKNNLAKKLGLNAMEKWMIVLQHPTPLDEIDFDKQISETLNSVSKISFEKIVIYPNNDTGSDIFIKKINKYGANKKFHIFQNLDRLTYLSLMKVCDIMVGNSSSGIIESGYFNIPVVDIGNRQLGRERGKNVIHVAYDEKQITNAIFKSDSAKFKSVCKNSINVYGKGGAGMKIVEIIEKNIGKPNLFYKKFTYV